MNVVALILVLYAIVATVYAVGFVHTEVSTGLRNYKLAVVAAFVWPLTFALLFVNRLQRKGEV